jgi:hypothetical protein
VIARAVPPRQRRILGGCASFGRHRSINVALKVGEHWENAERRLFFGALAGRSRWLSSALVGFRKRNGHGMI